MNHLHPYSFARDEDYLREIKAGGPRADQAVSGLYKKYHRRVLVSVSKIIARHPESKTPPEDLVHDAFIIMIQKIQFQDLHAHSLFGFWTGVGKYLLLNQLKKDERIILVKKNEEKYGLNEISPEDIYLHREEEEQLALTFSRLGAKCQEILMLWMNQYTMVEIAEKMNLSNDAMARKNKFECFKKLKELVRTGNKQPG
jgi:RNA polymerase sigma factor (sigma-70 family)